MNFESIDILEKEDISKMYDNIIEENNVNMISADNITGPWYSCYCGRNGRFYNCIHYANFTRNMYTVYCPNIGSGTADSEGFWGCSGVCKAVKASCNYWCDNGTNFEGT